METSTIVWFRQDLRIEDNPALCAALNDGPVIPLFVWSPEEEGDWLPGAASKWWLHHSLISLKADLKTLGLPLIVRHGNALDVIKDVIKSTGAKRVYWNRRYEPYGIARDTSVKKLLLELGVEANSYNANLLFEPWTISNKQGKPFQVFTPFWKTCLAQSSIKFPLPKPKPTNAVIAKFNQEIAEGKKLKSESIDSLDLLPKIHWEEGLKQTWQPGNEGAKKSLKAFIEEPVLHYAEERDRPDFNGVSMLSPYLHFGELSPRMIWHAIIDKFSSNEPRIECYLRQLGWREFAHHLLFHFPHTPSKPLRSNFSAFDWKIDPKGLKAWQKGMTGYPLVDAGMRQLWHTGWMHNRVRMIVGSFLVKDLRITWLEGAKWFWDTLVDADLANNTLGWQWIGGCGADAAPYFRIFNPITQGEKFDPEGAYVRQWIPELTKLPNKWIHRPWEAPPLLLLEAGITLGNTYPYPLVDHSVARNEALAAFAALRNNE
ncbi:MAG: deoxyribodipyrimidine photo-lyase [Parachlamydiaceae bacterium]|nr:deoxyribodipyrimidine photo-lyase [Parachlamydiaceae bacterium]